MSDSVGPLSRTLEARRIRPPGLDFHRSREATVVYRTARVALAGERSSGLSAPFIEASTAAGPYRLAIGGVGDDAGAVATRVLRIGGRTPPGRRGRVQAEQGGA